MRIKLTVLLLMCINFTSIYSQTKWKLEKDKEGIKIWTRKQANTNLKEYKGAIILNTTVDNILSFFRNYKLYEKWMYKTDAGSMKILKKYNDNDFVIRLTISAPLIKTRESITHFTINPADAKGVVLINLVTVPDFIPANDNYVRIPKMNGYWKIIPLENGTVELSHLAAVNAGGSIPDALANLSAVDAPFSMFQKIKTLIK